MPAGRAAGTPAAGLVGIVALRGAVAVTPDGQNAQLRGHWAFLSPLGLPSSLLAVHTIHPE